MTPKVHVHLFKFVKLTTTRMLRLSPGPRIFQGEGRTAWAKARKSESEKYVRRLH